MSTEFLTVEMPFLRIGNRRGLTTMQLVKMPWVLDFFVRFEDCFEYDVNRDVWLFDEEMAESPK